MKKHDIRSGTVFLVGAGPGDPGLITLRGVECLNGADVILCDYLANQTLLRHAKEGAEIIALGRHDSGRDYSQDEIMELMVDRAKRGLMVVRLKGGDPSIFGRGAEEAEVLRSEGIPYEIVPGITTGLAVAAYAEIPLTHRDESSAVALVTGRERHDREGDRFDYGALASFPGTLVFYMGVSTVDEWSAALMEGGKPADTPVGIVRWVSHQEQETHRCTLATVEEFVGAHGIEAPAVFVIGTVVDRGPELSWFVKEQGIEPRTT
ncbi:uroporphyrinogen-III C-methyltransferase [Candidatus Zixiibacteriota bacterium]